MRVSATIRAIMRVYTPERDALLPLCAMLCYARYYYAIYASAMSCLSFTPRAAAADG